MRFCSDVGFGEFKGVKGSFLISSADYKGQMFSPYICQVKPPFLFKYRARLCTTLFSLEMAAPSIPWFSTSSSMFDDQFSTVSR